MSKRGINPKFIKRMTRAKAKSAPTLSHHSLKSMKCTTPKCETVTLVDNNTTEVVCHICTTKLVGATIPNIAQSKYTSEERKERKARIAKKKAEALAYKEKYKDFPKGWWLKSVYIHTDGRKFQRGKEVDKITVKPKVVKKPSGMPRGWHLRKSFIHDGITYSFGKKVK